MSTPAHGVRLASVSQYVLHHLHVWLAVNKRETRAYQAQMAARYGQLGADVALRTLRGQMPASVW